LGLSVGKWVINAGSAMTLFALVVLLYASIHILRGMHPDYHPLRLVMPSLELSNLSIFAKMIFFGLTSFDLWPFLPANAATPAATLLAPVLSRAGYRFPLRLWSRFDPRV